jgi:hypothetical protein
MEEWEDDEEEVRDGEKFGGENLHATTPLL